MTLTRADFIDALNNPREITLGTLEEIIENGEIVERLKELLEGRTDDFTFTGRYLRKEVLREEK